MGLFVHHPTAQASTGDTILLQSIVKLRTDNRYVIQSSIFPYIDFICINYFFHFPRSIFILRGVIWYSIQPLDRCSNENQPIFFKFRRGFSYGGTIKNIMIPKLQCLNKTLTPCFSVSALYLNGCTLFSLFLTIEFVCN
jgi:hypothetical protein